MARLEGVIKLSGSIGGLSFFKTKDGYIARTKGGPDKKKVLNDPNFRRTRENFTEFGACVRCGSWLRQCTSGMNVHSRDSRLTGRLNKTMFDIKEQDALSARGQRTVAVGLSTNAGKEILKTIQFNAEAPLDSVLKAQHQLNTSNGVISFASVDGTSSIEFAQGATHAAITGGWARIDYNTGAREFSKSNTVYIVRGAAASAVNLVPASVPQVQGFDIFVLQLCFVQEINGVKYELNNGAFNSMKVIEVQ